MTEIGPHYREIAPTGILAQHVRCIWRLTGCITEPSPEPIIPDGCAELVLNVGEPFVEQASDGSTHRQPPRLVAGQITRALTVGPSGQIDIWGVRFHPWSAAAFLGVSADELRDAVMPLDDVAPRLERVVRPLEATGNSDVFERELVAALNARAAALPAVDPLAQRLVVAAARSRDDMTVRGLAKRTGLGARRVQVVFRDRVGLSPKQLLRINRFQRALGLARREPELSWGTIAIRAGYYDQAHLVHDSNDIAGTTPAKLLGRETALTELFLADGSGAA
jgi:AraC-like DNA-binding protein